MSSGMPIMTSALFGKEYFEKKIRKHQIILKSKEIADLPISDVYVGYNSTNVVKKVRLSRLF
jgi:hypothetical protein